ncbi:RsmB/NOP family class I SAM-dependent RNA methyltransferase [Aestuariivirga sp.]|uniref:RsmB/NOP family class I SAM-dependent RNA methyltransferase n=1 Tax=Aestuariivirga sp. TaxID=2650926 RepID=UPI0025B8A728|nr:RsmB/NOP family class I SAM-dependent RNA methyltransferase [Aestuariivirga sp.]MCA3554304.1 RsmB/NOP family class I SAM-dependent RNA methyltransferase [Aestuariivirga sp.]
MIPAATKGLEARRLAPLLLRACVDRTLTVEEAISGSRDAQALEPRNRALLATLLLTAFRHKGEIDAILAKLVDRPLPRKSGAAREILVLGIAQLLFLGMAPHAVIDLAVRSAKADRNALHFSGLINAVLRKVASCGAALRDGLDGPRLNTPDWLWSRWAKAYGEDSVRAIAQAHAERPGLDISFKSDAEKWAEPLGGRLLPNGQLRLPPGHAPVPDLPGFVQGAWWIQDAAATFPARLLGDVHGKTVLDLCAAPGGKTLQLAAAGARVTALDLSEARLRRLQENLVRTGLAVQVVAQNMLSPGLSGEWDAVLLDAPCSATGTIRRHPELPYVKDEAQIRELASLQRRMLRKAALLVKPGGTLIYCTCSLEPEEGETRVSGFLRDNPDFGIIAAGGSWLPEGAVRPEGWVRTLPSMQYGGSAGMDSFFAAALHRHA